MSDRDVQIGRNLVRLRDQRTQQDIAASMRSAGYKWSQATVWAVEKGERPLKLTEAETLAEVMGTTVASFTKTEQAVQLAIVNAQMHETYQRLRAVVNDFFDAQVNLAVVADQAMRDEHGSGILQAVDSWMHMSPEDVVTEVRTDRKASAMTRRLTDAMYSGFKTVAEFDAAEAADSDNDRTGPNMRMLNEVNYGEHTEEG